MGKEEEGPDLVSSVTPVTPPGTWGLRAADRDPQVPGRPRGGSGPPWSYDGTVDGGSGCVAGVGGLVGQTDLCRPTGDWGPGSARHRPARRSTGRTSQGYSRSSTSGTSNRWDFSRDSMADGGRRADEGPGGVETVGSHGPGVCVSSNSWSGHPPCTDGTFPVGYGAVTVPPGHSLRASTRKGRTGVSYSSNT